MSKILLVEDRLSFLDLWQIELKKHGHEVICTRNENKAIQELTEQSFDAVVIDVHLVDGGGSAEGGLVVARWIREDQKDHCLPIIFAAVNPDEQHHKEFGLLMEKDKTGEVLLKPFSSRTLRETVETLIQ